MPDPYGGDDRTETGSGDEASSDGGWFARASAAIGQLIQLPQSQEPAITPTPSAPAPPPTAPAEASAPLPALATPEPTMAPPTGAEGPVGPVAPPAPSPQVTPDQEQFHVGLPNFDPGALAQRVGQVINIARQMTGGLLQPEIVHDLARSGLPMDQVATVIGFMLNNGGQRDAVLSETDQMAHNITQAAAPFLQGVGDYFQGVGQREGALVQGLVAPFQQIGSDFGGGNMNKGIVDVLSLANPNVRNLTAMSFAGIQNIAQGLSKGTAFDDQVGMWVPGPNGDMVNTQTGKSVVPFTPEWDALQATQRLALVAPRVGMQDMGVPAQGTPAHTVTDIRHDLFNAGYIKDESRIGPLQQDEVAAWRQWYDHQGGANVQIQLQLQAAGFGNTLPITGFFNADNDTGKQWIAAANDYDLYNQQVNDHILQHTEDAILTRDMGVGPILLALKNGDLDWAKKEFQRFNRGWMKTPTTGGVPGIGQVEMSLRLGVALTTSAGAMFNTLPNGAVIADKIQSDPEWQGILKQALDSGAIDRDWYRQQNEMGGKQGYDVIMAATQDPALRERMHALVLKHLAEYGYFNAQGGPLGQSNKYLGGVAELLNTTMNPDPQSRKLANDFMEDHPLVTDLANMLLTWKMIPGRAGATVRSAPGEAGAFARAGGGLDGTGSFIASEQWREYQAGRLADQERVGSVANTGLTHPHFLETQNFRPAQTVEQGIRDFHGPAQEFTVVGDPDTLYRVQQDLAKPGTRLQAIAYDAEPDLQATAYKPTARYGEKTSAELAQQVQDSGGFTYQPHSKLTPTNGFAVVANKATAGQSRHIVIPASEKNIAGEIDKYVASNRSLKNLNNAMGAWKDEAGDVHLEISRVVRSEQEAIKIGKANGQKEYYDIAKNESKPVTQAAGKVSDQPVGPGTGSVAQGATGTAGLRVSAQLPWEYDAVRNATDGRNVRVHDAAGNEVSPRYAGPIMTKSVMRDIVLKQLDTLNTTAPGILTTRMGLPSRINMAIDAAAHDGALAPVMRQLAIRAYNGVLDFNDPKTITDLKHIVRQYVHDPILQRSMIQDAIDAARQGPKGYLQGESVVHQIFQYVHDNYTIDKATAVQQIERSGDAAGFAMPTGEGLPTERSIYNTHLGGYATYFPSLDTAVAKSPGLAFLKDAQWAGSDKIQAAWKAMDDATSQFAVSGSNLANQANFWVYRKWATYVSPPFQAKVLTRQVWVTLTEGIKASRTEKAFTAQMLDQNPGGFRLVHEVIKRQQAGDTTWYYAGQSGDHLHADGLAKVARSDQMQIFRDVYGQKLSDLLGPEGYAQMGASLRLTVDGLRDKVNSLHNVPKGGEAYFDAQSDLPGLQKSLVRHENALKDWTADKVSPLTGGQAAIETRLAAWLMTPAGKFFRDSLEAQTGGKFDDAVATHYVNAASKHLNDLWFDRPNVRDAIVSGERDGGKLLDIAKNKDELFDDQGRTWFPVKTEVKDSENSLVSALKATDAKVNSVSYWALKAAKDNTFRDLTAKYLYRLKPAIEDGRLAPEEAIQLAAFKARDMSNDLMFDLKSSMLQGEARLRFLAPFATKRRLFWQHLGSKALTDPRIQMAMAEVSQHIEAMNKNENANNKDKVTFTLPVGILGFAKGSTVDFHLYNQFWVGQNDELENYALLQAAANAIGVTHPDPAQKFKGVFGYYPSANAPSASLFPRVGDLYIWARAAMQSQGKWPGNPMTTEDIYKGMPPDLAAQHQRLANAIQAQAFREGRNMTPDEASQAAFLDLLMHSGAKIGLPGAPGITPEEQVAARDEITQYWNATSKQEIDALEAKYPGLQTELKLTRDPAEFKQWLVASARANVIQADFAKQIAFFETSHKITALITDKVAVQELAQIKRVRDDAYAQLAQDYPIWGESHGYGARDPVTGAWKTNDDVKRMLSERGSPQELAPGQEGLLQQAKAMYSNFIDANNIVPISDADHDNLLKVLETYKSLDDAITRFQDMPETAQGDKTLTDLRIQRSRYITEWQSMLDAYWPHGQKTTLEAAREQYYKDIYTPYVAAQKPLFDAMDPTVNPWLTSKQKGALDDQITAIKNTFNHPFTLPQYPGTMFPPPEQINWQNKSPLNQAQDLARWQVIATHHSEWLTTFQLGLLRDPQQLGQMISSWDRPTYNMYLATLKDELNKFRSGGGFGGMLSQESAENAWRRQMAASGHEPNIFKVRVPVTNDNTARSAPSNVFA